MPDHFLFLETEDGDIEAIRLSDVLWGEYSRVTREVSIYYIQEGTTSVHQQIMDTKEEAMKFLRDLLD